MQAVAMVALLGLVSAQPPPPPSATCNDDMAQTNMDKTVIIDVLANDVFTGDISGLVLKLPPASVKGGLLQLAPGNKVRYTPPTGWVGEDTFRYDVDVDGIARFAIVKIIIIIIKVKGDPHVTTPHGTVDMWLPVDEWTPLLQGPTFELLGKGMGVPSTGSTHWFNGIAVKKSDDVVVEAFLPCDPSNFADANTDLNYLVGFINGERMLSKDIKYNETDLTVVASDSKLTLNQKYLDVLDVVTSDFAFKLHVAYHRKPDEKKSGLDNAVTPRVHLDLDFTSSLIDDSLSGFFAEVSAANVTARSKSTKKLLEKPKDVGHLRAGGACVDIRA